MRKIGCFIIILIVAALAVIGGNFIYGWHADGPSDREVTIEITQGSTLRDAAKALEQGNVIKSADAFYQRARLLGGSTSIKAGEFVIPARASNASIMSILQGGKSKQRLVTIPEGFASIQVYDRLLANEILTGEIDVPREGSILPDSYSFEKGETRAQILARMTSAMDEVLANAWANKSPNTVVKSAEEAIILASIIEKETALPEEYRTVASVYSNRLKKNMLLQADPTAIYPLTKGKPLGRKLYQSDLLRDNPYNTYVRFGLPEGPIANPSKEAIEAALNPAKTDYVFFVADGKGGHDFSKTYEEHQEKVQKWYQIRDARLKE